MATTTEPPVSFTTTTSTNCDSNCTFTRCQQHRRTVRKQLQRWSKNVVYLVGFEEVAKSMMGPEKWLKSAAQYNPAALSTTVSGSEPEQLKDFDVDNPETIHSPLCPTKISNLVDPIDHLTNPLVSEPLPHPPHGSSYGCSCDPPVEDCPTCIDDSCNSSAEDSVSESSLNEQPMVEQPLDLSIKGTSSTAIEQVFSSPSKEPSSSTNSKLVRTSASPSKPSSVPRKSKAPKNWNRGYTEEALAQALDAIERGELGTRRAALIYKVPRSTLRNKVYKMNLKPNIRQKKAAAATEQNSLTESKVVKSSSAGDLPTSSDPEHSSVSNRGRGQTSEALREMLMKRESVRSSMNLQPQQPAHQQQPFVSPQVTYPSSSSPFLSEQTFINDHLNSVPLWLEGLLTGTGTTADLQSEYLRCLILYCFSAQIAQHQSQSNGGNQNQSTETTAPFDWQHVFQTWMNQLSGVQQQQPSDISNQCNPFLQSLYNESSLSMNEQFHPNQSNVLKSQFDDPDNDEESDHDSGQQIDSYKSYSPFTEQSMSKSSSYVNNSATCVSNQLILKVPSFKSNSTGAALKGKGNRSQNYMAIQPKPITSMIVDSKPVPGFQESSFGSPSSTLDVDDGDNYGIPFEPKLVIKSEESLLVDSAKSSKKKKRGENLVVSNDQSNDGSNSRNRPKRGRYRNYNREDLEQAVKAVQDGKMSVHKAGNHFGVPHSTLEYKVKDRRTLRQRKQQLGTNAADSMEDAQSTRNSRTSSTDSVPSNIQPMNVTLPLPSYDFGTKDNDTNNNSLWNDQVTNLKTSTVSPNVFSTAENLKKFHEIIKSERNPALYVPSNGLLEILSGSKSVKSEPNIPKLEQQESDEESMDVVTEDLSLNSNQSSSLNVLREVIGSSIPSFPSSNSAL